MNAYPKSPKEMTSGMMYFPRMLDKIRLHAHGELSEDYHANLGHRKATDACCNFLRVNHVELRERERPYSAPIGAATESLTSLLSLLQRARKKNDHADYCRIELLFPLLLDSRRGLR